MRVQPRPCVTCQTGERWPGESVRCALCEEEIRAHLERLRAARHGNSAKGRIQRARVKAIVSAARTLCSSPDPTSVRWEHLKALRDAVRALPEEKA